MTTIRASSSRMVKSTTSASKYTRHDTNTHKAHSFVGVFFIVIYKLSGEGIMIFHVLDLIFKLIFWLFEKKSILLQKIT